MRFLSLGLVVLASSGCALVDAAGETHEQLPDAGVSFSVLNIDNTTMQPRNAAFAHVDTGPDLDVVIVGQQGEIFVSHGDGAGGFDAATKLDVAGNGWDLIAAADLGDDMRDELVLAATGKLGVLRANDGVVGGFDLIDLGAPAGEPCAIAAATFDNGQALVIATKTSENLLVIKQPLATSESSMIPFGSTAHTIELGVGRVRGGSNSLIAAEIGVTRMTEFGDPGSQSPAMTGVPLDGSVGAFAVGQFGGMFEDDVAYLVLGEGGAQNRIDILDGSPAGLRQGVEPSIGQGTQTQLLAAGDFDGDDLDDLAALVVNADDTRHIQFFIQRASGGFPTARLDVDGHPGRLAFGDVNGDGKTDVALAQDDTQQPPRGGLNILLSN